MTLSKLTLSFAALFFLTSCKSQIRLPKNLDEAVLYFQQKWTGKELDKFKNMSEKEALIEIHFGTGQWIRNNWVYGNRDTVLRNYFHSLGVFHPDDISAIILISLHRTLNKNDIELSKQIEHYQAYWKPIIDCEKKQISDAVLNYNKFRIGDSISIYMPVDSSDGSGNAVLYDCPTTEWNFDTDKDLLVKGIITNKYFINDTANVFFTVHITYMNRKDTPILMTEVKTGDEKDFSLSGITIK